MFDIKKRDTFSDIEKLLFNIWQELFFLRTTLTSLSEVETHEQEGTVNDMPLIKENFENLVLKPSVKANLKPNLKSNLKSKVGSKPKSKNKKKG